jgi:hypothetical protein
MKLPMRRWPIFASLPLTVLVAAASCSSGSDACPSTPCGGSSDLSYGTCVADDGSKTYSFAGQTCSCPSGDAMQCSQCAASVQLYCEGVSQDGSTDDSSSGSGSSSGGSGSGSGSGSGGGSGGSSGSSGGIMDSSAPPCTMLLSGAVNASESCEVTVSYSNLTMRGTVVFTVPMPAPLQQVNVTIGQPGLPMTGIWSDTDPGATANIVAAELVDSSVANWQCSVGGGTTKGSYTLDLTLGMPEIMPNGETFGANGTLQATLPAAGDAGASVTLRASF